MQDELEVSDALLLRLMREQAVNLVTSSEIARRIGGTRQTVTTWHQRYPDFNRRTLVSMQGQAYLHWWPAVREWLDDSGRSYGEPAPPGSRIRCHECHELIEPVDLMKPAGTSDRFQHFNSQDCVKAIRRRGHAAAALAR